MFEKEYLPQCLAMGIRAEDFWHMTMLRLRPYLEAERIKKENQNYMMWLQGAYIMNALECAIHNAFAKKGTKPLKYLEKPIRITEYTESEKILRAEEERKKAIAFFDRMIKNSEKEK